MPRPQVYDRDAMLDAAEELAVEGGVKAVTIRAVSERAGISNGAIYHAFGSRGGLVGRAWVRAARRFLALQKQAVDAEDEPVRAVIAAADAPAVFSEQYPSSTRLVLGTRREELIGDAPAEVQAELRALDTDLRDLLIRLSIAMWDRKDAASVAVIEDCVVGLPTGLMLRRPMPPTDDTRRRLAAAVEAILSVKLGDNKMPAHLEITDDIAVLNLGDDENRFSPDWLTTVNGFLDRIESGEAKALVTTGSGKFYSNGLDLDWLAAHSDQGDWYVGQVQQLLARVLVAPVPTVAAVNGHAFGAGSMLGIAHDFRVMRVDRGYYCFPEVDIHIPFTPGMAALIQAKLTPAAAVEAMTTGRRYGGADAEAIGLVTATAPEGKVTSTAVDLVAALKGKDPGTLQAIKSTMFASVTAALRGKA